MSEFNKFADLMIEAAYQENIKNLGKPMAKLMKQSVIQLKPVIEIFFNKGMEIGKAQAVPEGFVLFPKKQTSKMRSLARDFDARLSLTKYEQLHNIWVKQAMLEALEPAND